MARIPEEILSIHIRSTEGSPLLMHNIRLANPLNDYSKRLKKLTSLRKKTDENHMEIADVEFEGALYHDPDMGPFIPGHWLDACLCAGGKLQKNGTKIKESVLVLEDKVPLQYEGPRDIKSLQSDPKHRDFRAVTIQRARLMRCRPMFTKWEAKFTIRFDPQIINKEELMDALYAAGHCKGIGDFRPRFGRFEVVE